MKKFLPLLLAVLLLIGAAAAEQTADPIPARDTLFQVSTIQALTAGDYHGLLPVSTLLTYGDTGLGTFEGLEGEMIVLDGACYQALADGTVRTVPGDVLVPFAAVTFLDPDTTGSFDTAITFEEMKAAFDAIVLEQGANTFYVCRVEGTFPAMKVRAIFKQEEPYEPMAAVTDRDQRVHDYTDVEGSLVAFYLPAYAKGVNAAGWHFHFLDKAHEKGGHVMDFTCTAGDYVLDKTTAFVMTLPDTDYFNHLDLMSQEEAVAKVEKGE